MTNNKNNFNQKDENESKKYNGNFFKNYIKKYYPEQKEINPKLIALAKKHNIPMVVTNDIHYMNKEDAEAQDVLRCIGFKKLLSDTDRQTMGNGRTEWYFKTEQEMRLLFPELPEAPSAPHLSGNVREARVSYRLSSIRGKHPQR